MKNFTSIGEPIVLNVFPGGMDSPTFMNRRKVTFNVWLEAESLEIVASGGGSRFGEMFASLLRDALNAENGEP